MKHTEKKREIKRSLAISLAVMLLMNALPLNASAVSLGDVLDLNNEMASEETVSGNSDEILTVSGSDMAKEEQAQFGFAISEPRAVTYVKGGNFENPASGGSGSGEISYSVETEGGGPAAATVDAVSGTVTLLSAGTVTVRATKDGDETYKETSAFYNLTIEKADREGFRFREQNPVDFIYTEGGNNVFSNTIELDDVEGITYTVTDDVQDKDIASIDEHTGELTLSGTGTITVTAFVAEDGSYKAASASYRMVVRDATGAMSFGTAGPVRLVFRDGLTYVNTVASSSGGTIEYSCMSSSDQNVVDVDRTSGKVTVHKAGSVTITAVDTLTPQQTASYELIIEKADQMVSFANPNPADIVFGETFGNTASSRQAAGETVLYSSDNDLVAEVNQQGDLIIKKAGRVRITATIGENDKYKAAGASYTLTIGKAPQEISFPQSAYQLIYGTNFSAGNQPQASLIKGQGSGAIIYSVTGGTDIAEIGQDGVLSFRDGKWGSVTVCAVKEADDCYREAKASYALMVSCLKIPEDTVVYDVISDTAGSNGWYTGNVSLKAAAGYSLSRSNSLGAENVWGNRLTDVVTQDGASQEVSFYVMENSTGGISDRITVEINKDGSLPGAGIQIREQELTLLQKLLSFFGLSKQGEEKAEVKIIGYDTTSGVAGIEYFISEGLTPLQEDSLPQLAWMTYDPDAGLIYSADKKFTVYARVTDQAGNCSYASSNGIILDKATPAVSLNPVNTAIDIHAGGDVDIRVSAQDVYSGLKQVEYRITCDGQETRGKTILYSFDKENPREEDLFTAEYTGMITVPAEENNSDNVKVIVTAEDNAGNVTEQSIDLKIDKTAPYISVSMNDAAPCTMEGERGYYDDIRTAVVTIRERTTGFDREEATRGIGITAKDADGQNIPTDNMISGWTTVEGDAPDAAIHTCIITFDKDANYEWSIEYTDKAGNANSPVITEGATPFSFTVDTNNPTGTVSIDKDIWSGLLETLTFGLFKNDTVSVTATADDATSPYTVEYYISERTTAVTVDELENLGPSDWTVYHPFKINDEKLFSVYLRITDYADHCTYLSTNGFIVDKTASKITLLPDKPNENGLYNSKTGVGVDVTVEELPESPDNPVYSGIELVEYWVSCDGNETQREILYAADSGEAAFEELMQMYQGRIIVDAFENNSDNVVLYVRTVDNAGNENTESAHLKIDITEPVIAIDFYERPVTVIESDEGKRGYFGQNRQARISITERTSNFDAAAAMEGIQISAVNAKGEEVPLPLEDMLHGWDTFEGDNPDKAVHTTLIDFTEDGNYTWFITYSDEAGNEGTLATSGDTPFHFTVDKLKPIDFSLTIEENRWASLLEKLTFGLWKNKTVKVTAAADDETSPVKIEYITTADVKAKSFAQLDAVTDWKPYREFTVDTDQVFVVYAKISDYAGNYLYIGSDGFIVDKTQSRITLTPVTDSQNGIFNSDVDVEIEITDQYPYSGINTVEYWVSCDGRETYRETLYKFNNLSPDYEDLTDTFAKTVTVSAKDNNSCNVLLYVQTTDNAGNTAQKSIPLDIDVTAPEIRISYDNNDEQKIVDGRGYFNNLRTATVIITERTQHFDPDKATAGISIAAVDRDGNSIADVAGMISGWNTVEGASPDEAVHTASIYYDIDGNYTVDIQYTDRAGNKNTPVNTGSSVTPFVFTVDRLKPTGRLTVGELGVWDSLLDVISFGLWSRNTVTVSGSAEDTISPLETLEYYKTEENIAKTSAELDAVNNWLPFQGLTIDSDERFVVYLRATDYAGNITYISTDGVIVDETAPLEETLAPRIAVNANAHANDISNSDVGVDIQVLDPVNGGTYSGLKRITYQVLNMGEETQSGSLFEFDKTAPKQEELLQSWTGSITVNSSLNNSNDVAIIVAAEDNAGNTSSRRENIKIDVTKPAIRISYDNNEGDTSFGDQVYFKADRTASIEITERNFSSEMVKIEIANTDGTIPSVTGWSKHDGSGNGDDIRYTATVTFSEDGDYRFAISYTDNAGNAADNADFGNSLAPASFTVDKTLPVIEVTYDNNASINDNYYASARTATVTVDEHNFDPSRVDAVITATDNGNSFAAPRISGWSNQGNIHTATVTYAEDAYYTFDISYMDMAGNTAAEFTEQAFYVDQTAPDVEIRGIADRSAYREGPDGSNQIGFTVQATDTNFDIFAVTLTGVVKEDNRYVTRTIDVGEYAAIGNGQTLRVEDISLDGIYTIRCDAVDKAGNTFTEVTLHDERGNAYEENRSGQEDLLTFSVNRNGSTFATDEKTAWLVGDTGMHYVRGVAGNVVVYEVNVDALNSCAVTLNDRLLAEGSDYERTLSEREEKGWYQYVYTLDKALFEKEDGMPADGEYNIVISSVDEAQNEAYSDVKDCRLRFVVDTKAPDVTIMSGLTEGGRYQTQKQKVVIRPVDDGGELASVRIQLLDRSGNVTATPIDLSGDAFVEELAKNGGNLEFNIGEGMYQQVRIFCSDTAEDEQGAHNIYEQTYKDITVSTNAFMIFWANKPLRWSVIAGSTAAAGVGGGAAHLLLRRKRLLKLKKK